MPAALLQEKPDVTYNDVGGAKEQLERLREACPKFPIESFWVWSFGWSWCREDLGWPPAGKGTTKKDIRDFGILVRTVRSVALSALLLAQATVRAVQFWSPVAQKGTQALSFLGAEPGMWYLLSLLLVAICAAQTTDGGRGELPGMRKDIFDQMKDAKNKGQLSKCRRSEPIPHCWWHGCLKKAIWLWNKREKSPPHIGAQNEQASNHQITGFEGGVWGHKYMTTT